MLGCRTSALTSCAAGLSPETLGVLAKTGFNAKPGDDPFASYDPESIQRTPADMKEIAERREERIARGVTGGNPAGGASGNAGQ